MCPAGNYVKLSLSKIWLLFICFGANIAPHSGNYGEGKLTKVLSRKHNILGYAVEEIGQATSFQCPFRQSRVMMHLHTLLMDNTSEVAWHSSRVVSVVQNLSEAEQKAPSVHDSYCYFQFANLKLFPTRYTCTRGFAATLWG